MAVPKNFNQIDKRVESLNELTFYTVKYDYKLTDKYADRLKLSDLNETLDELDEYVNGVLEFSALNDKVANKKLSEHLDTLVKNGIIEHYKVLDIESKSFHDKLKDEKLDVIINMDERMEWNHLYKKEGLN